MIKELHFRKFKIYSIKISCEILKQILSIKINMTSVYPEFEQIIKKKFIILGENSKYIT